MLYSDVGLRFGLRLVVVEPQHKIIIMLEKTTQNKMLMVKLQLCVENIALWMLIEI